MFYLLLIDIANKDVFVDRGRVPAIAFEASGFGPDGLKGVLIDDAAAPDGGGKDLFVRVGPGDAPAEGDAQDALAVVFGVGADGAVIAFDVADAREIEADQGAVVGLEDLQLRVEFVGPAAVVKVGGGARVGGDTGCQEDKEEREECLRH